MEVSVSRNVPSVNSCFKAVKTTGIDNVTLTFRVGLAVLAATVVAVVLGYFAIAGLIVLSVSGLYLIGILAVSVYNGCIKKIE